jgi:hypothetical protein
MPYIHFSEGLLLGLSRARRPHGPDSRARRPHSRCGCNSWAPPSLLSHALPPFFQSQALRTALLLLQAHAVACCGSSGTWRRQGPLNSADVFRRSYINAAALAYCLNQRRRASHGHEPMRWRYKCGCVCCLVMTVIVRSCFLATNIGCCKYHCRPLIP